MSGIVDKVVQAVENINTDIFEQTEADEEYGTTICCCTALFYGNEVYVEFCGLPIWDSDTDEREYVDDLFEEQKEQLEPYLRREINKLVQKISEINL